VWVNSLPGPVGGSSTWGEVLVWGAGVEVRRGPGLENDSGGEDFGFGGDREMKW
jgi:hypothetical protein